MMTASRRFAVAAFATGALVSVAANIVSAEPTVVGRVVSGWPAAALIMTVHLFQHCPRSFPIKLSILAVAAVAAWTSYWHMVEVATVAGETPVTAHLLPITVDAMMYVASMVMIHKVKPATRKTTSRKARAN